MGLSDRAVATSGDYRNFFEAGGQRYSHTIDPRTGRPVTHPVGAVSVIDTMALRADAWATALMVLGPEQGLALAEQQGIAALFITRDRHGTLHETSSPAFAAFRRAQ